MISESSFNPDDDSNQMLTYGDIISLGLPDDPNLFIFTDGFIKNRIYLKNFKDDHLKGNYSRCLFQIYPQFANTFKKQAQTLEEEFKSSKFNIQKKRQLVEELQQKITDEYKFNMESFEKHKNTPLTYGKVVQFLHVASNKFLSINFVEAEQERENYKIELSEYSSDSTFFKFLPSYKYQKESEGTIYISDVVSISFAQTYMSKIPFLHCNTNRQISKEVFRLTSGPNAFLIHDNNIKVDKKIKNLN